VEILITLGPMSWEPDVLRALLREGISKIRFPFAKETPEIHARHHELVRDIADDVGAHVETIADLPGSMPRLDNDVPIDVNQTERYTLALDPDSQAQLALVPALTGQAPDVGSRALIGDGENAFIVDGVERKVLTGHFERPGTIERRRAFVLPREEMCIASFTDADKRFAAAAHKADFDWLAISFADSGELLTDVRAWLASELGWHPKIMAKVETPTGVLQAAGICARADAVLVGRGDLALHIGPEGLYDAQREVISVCRAHNTYVAVGTGFVESVARSGGVATRSEAIDVRCTLEMGADALLLSAETTVGVDPVGAVRQLRRLAGQG
jgi:pyruvate kinase